MADRAVSILHIFPSFAIGGQQRRLATLVDALGPQFSHKILALDGDLGGSVLFGGAKPLLEPLVIEKSAFTTLGNLAKLRRAIAESSADLLCTYNFGSIEAALANSLGARLPHVHHEDGFGPDEADGRQKRRRVLARRALLKNATIAVPSRGLEEIALKVWKMDAGSVVRIPVGVDCSKFDRPKREWSGPVTVGSIGSLRAEKNFARLIRCFEAASEGRDARLVIYGDGPERRALQEIATQSRASGKISLPGATSDVTGALSEFDIFALTSDTEQMPTSLLEAMAAGLPAIAVSVGEVPNMIEGEGADYVFNREDEQGFACALRSLFEDVELRRRLGEANRLRAKAFDASAMTKAFRTLYAEAAGAKA